MQQKERDKELTFQPNLAKTKYYKTGCQRRRNVYGEVGEPPVASEDCGDEETGGGDERAPQGAVRELQRFEMLYDDVSVIPHRSLSKRQVRCVFESFRIQAQVQTYCGILIASVLQARAANTIWTYII